MEPIKDSGCKFNTHILMCVQEFGKLLAFPLDAKDKRKDVQCEAIIKMLLMSTNDFNVIVDAQQTKDGMYLLPMSSCANL